MKENNVELKSFYNIEISAANSIKITAKEAIADLIPTTFFSSSALVTSTIETDLLNPPRKNIFIVTEIFKQDVNDPTQFEEILKSSVAPDDNGEVNIDISTALDAELINSFITPPLPEDIDSDVPKKSNVTIGYYLRTAESINGEISEWVYDDCVRTGVCGGVSKEDFPKLDPFSFIALEKKFLTWYPNNKSLHIDQPDWLTWINSSNEDSSFRVIHKAYYKDGTSSADVQSVVVNLDRWESLVAPVGYTQLDIVNINPLKEVFKWEVWIIDSVSLAIVSEVKSFLLDCTLHECSNLIIYLNSMCSPESLLTRGEWITNLEVNRSFSNKTLTHDYKVVNGQEFQFQQTSKNNFEARTGYLRKVDALALQDLLIQSNSFLIEDGDYIPIILDGNSFKITECNQFLNLLSFKVKKSLLMNQYSQVKKKPIIIPIISCGLGGFDYNDNGLEITTFGDLSIYDSDGGLIETVAIGFPLPVWSFLNKITQEGVYTVIVQLILSTGEVLDYNFNYRLVNKHIVYKTTDTGFHFISVDHTGIADSWINFKDGNGEVLNVLNGPTILSTVLPALPATRSIDLNLHCPEKINFFLIIGSNISEIDLNELKNVTDLILPNNGINGDLDISEFLELENLNCLGNNFDNAIFGYHPSIENINLSGNNISQANFDVMLFSLWNFRNQYTFSGIVLNISGNTGLPLSAYANSIINGTGDFVGEGLVPDYGWIVIT